MSIDDVARSRWAALRLARRLQLAHSALEVQPAGTPGLTLANVLQLLNDASTATLLLLRWLAGAYRLAGRWLRPRAEGWLAEGMCHWWAGWIALQALVIFLPLPLGNLLPALSLVALGLGRLLRDGLMVGLSLLFGALGLAYTAAVGHVVWDLALAVGAAVRG